MDQNQLQYPSLAELPIGLGMALMQNKTAMDYFASLSDDGKQRVINHTHTVQSKEEMQAFMDSLASVSEAF